MDNNLADVAVLFDFYNDVGSACGVVKDVLKFLKMIFDVLANGRGSVYMTPGVFEFPQLRASSFLSAPLAPAGGFVTNQTTARLSREPGIDI